MILVLVALLGVGVLVVVPWAWLTIEVAKASRAGTRLRIASGARSFQVAAGTVIGLIFLAQGLVWYGTPMGGATVAPKVVAATAILGPLLAIALVLEALGSCIFAVLVRRARHSARGSSTDASTA